MGTGKSPQLALNCHQGRLYIQLYICACCQGTEMHTKNSALAYWCFPRLIKVAYSSWLLLLWLTSLYLVTGLGSQDDTLRSVILAIALPVVAFTILSFPLVLYIGGSKVSLPDACADVFPPRRCCEVSKCCEGEE